MTTIVQQIVKDTNMPFSGFDHYYAYRERDMLFALVIDHLIERQRAGLMTPIERDCALLEANRCIETDYGLTPGSSMAALKRVAAKYEMKVEGGL